MFILHARTQREQLVADLKRFSLFNCLDNREFAQLASPHSTGIAKVAVHDYLPNEIIAEEGQHQLDHLHLVVQGAVRMEKVLHLKSKDGHSSAEKGTSAALKDLAWAVAEKVNCGIGEIKTYEHFGLAEMLHCCIAKNNQGEKGSSLPAPCRFSAKSNEMTTRVLKISSTDFLKIMPLATINQLLDKFRNEVYKTVPA